MEIELSRGLKLGPFASTCSQIGSGTTLTFSRLLDGTFSLPSLQLNHRACLSQRSQECNVVAPVTDALAPTSGCLDSLLQELVVLEPDTLIRQPHLSAFWSTVLSLRMSHRLMVE